jgi:hypothetical protein
MWALQAAFESSTEAMDQDAMQTTPGTTSQSESKLKRGSGGGSRSKVLKTENIPIPSQEEDLDSNGLEEIMDGIMVDSKTKFFYYGNVNRRWAVRKRITGAEDYA